jgi:hypothetical protein
MPSDKPVTTIKPIAIGKTVRHSDTGQYLLYIEVQLEGGEWVTWVIPEMSCKVIDNDSDEPTLGQIKS